MRLFLTVLLVAAVGCATPENDTVVTDSDTTFDSTPAAALAAQTTYTCESGATVVASYPTDSTAVVEVDGQTLQMEIAVSGSGARYVGDDLEWWTQGTDEGTLFRHNSDGTSGEMVTTCAVQP